MVKVIQNSDPLAQGSQSWEFFLKKEVNQRIKSIDLTSGL